MPLTACAAAAVLFAQAPATFPPKDEGPQEAQFITFRTSMLAALKKGNHQYVTSRIDPKIMWSFGMDAGKSQFLEFWESMEGGYDGMYQEMYEVLKLGGGWHTDGQGTRAFWAPYTHHFWPESLEPEMGVVVKANAPLYAEPKDDAEVLGRLSYEVVEWLPTMDDAPELRGWNRVKTRSGTEGWLGRYDVRTAYDYRMAMEKKRGSYYITVFIAGD